MSKLPGIRGADSSTVPQLPCPNGPGGGKMLIHRLFCGIRITLGNSIGNLGMALKCELFGDLVTLNFSPTLHEPIDHDGMNGTENRITGNLKENPVELDIGLHEQA